MENHMQQLCNLVEFYEVNKHPCKCHASQEKELCQTPQEGLPVSHSPTLHCPLPPKEATTLTSLHLKMVLSLNYASKTAFI